MELNSQKRNENPFIKWGTLVFNSQHFVIGQRSSQGSQSLCFVFRLVRGGPRGEVSAQKCKQNIIPISYHSVSMMLAWCSVNFRESFSNIYDLASHLEIQIQTNICGSWWIIWKENDKMILKHNTKA